VTNAGSSLNVVDDAATAASWSGRKGAHPNIRPDAGMANAMTASWQRDERANVTAFSERQIEKKSVFTRFR
jgi:hypothetical protein